MDGRPMNEFRVHRPGAVSMSFICEAALFAAGFWGWLAALALRGTPVTGWTVVAGAGAATTTLVAAALWIRYSVQNSAADRHEQIMENLVDLSWQTFAMSVRDQPREPGWDSNPDLARGSRAIGPDAPAIRSSQETRPRPRR